MADEIVNLDVLQQMVYPNVICVVPLKEGGKQLCWSTNGISNKRTVTIDGEYFVLSSVYREIPVGEMDPHYYGCSDFSNKEEFALKLEKVLNDPHGRHVFYDQPDLSIHVNMEMKDRIVENFVDVTIRGKALMGNVFPEPTWAILLPGDCSVVEKL